MKINVAKYEIEGEEMTIRRGSGSMVIISYREQRGAFHTDNRDRVTTTTDPNRVRVLSHEIFLAFHGYEGTNGDADDIYRAIMAFEN